MKRMIQYLILFLVMPLISKAQDNYEIQVYGSQTVQKKYTMVELHSNFTFDGSRKINNGVLPTNHILHETIEITHGVTDFLEVGFYFFNAIGNDNRTAYVGSHIRPRVMLPEKYHFPLGLSLSAEIGYQKRDYSQDDWTLEIRPIIDKKINLLYLSFNPTFDKSLHGANVKNGFNFSPDAKVSYDITKVFSPGLEYYGSIGNLNSLLPYNEQQHQLFFSLDLNINPDWELNFGYGLGFTTSTDKSILKCIIGYSIHDKEKKSSIIK